MLLCLEHTACGTAQQHTRSIENPLPWKIRSHFGCQVAEIAQAPAVMQPPACPGSPEAAQPRGCTPRSTQARGQLGGTAGPWQRRSLQPQSQPVGPEEEPAPEWCP